MQRLEELIQSASFSELGPTLEAWSENDKRAGAKWLQGYWKAQCEALACAAERETFFVASHKGDAHPSTSVVLWVRLCIANVTLARAPKNALSISIPQRPTGWRHHYWVPNEGLHALFAALAAKGVAWLAEYMLLAISAKRVARQNIPVAVSLIAGLGLPWPQASEFYTFWAEEVSCLSPLRERQERYEESVAVLAIDSTTGLAAPLETVAAPSYLEAVRALPAMDTLLFWLLARRDGILDLLERYSGPEDAELKTDLVAGLVAGGQVDRTALVDALLVALTRGDSVSAQRFQARLLAATATEVELLADHHNALLSLLASAHGSAAAVAQTLLTRADEHCALESGLFVGACEMVFARKEKGLRDAQLAWASKRFVARAEQATETLSGVFAALAIDELAFQKKVVALILKHWSHDAGSQDTLRAQLDAYREVLDAGLYLQLNEALGVSDPSPAHDMVSLPDLPSAPIADLRSVTRFSAPPGSAAALRELQAQFPHQASVDTCEQLICVALELAATDRHALELGLHEISDDFPLGLLGRLQLAAFDSFDPNSAVERSSWDQTDFARIAFLA
ncbi:MAG TPA: DUF6493 family protein, partial [Rhodocyclaceae bacterium]|nr:DUF6493 family protein [Rhodocyclaceae bacterium]